ncbi:MAG: replication initiator protein [Microvirus sp.]|nr:MAG: replication initiator protein [Microvirus sp.]
MSFTERGKIAGQLKLPCGRCIGCRVKRAQSWAIRCMHESQMHSKSSFVTLTYDDEHYSPSLEYHDFQLFVKRMRRENSNRLRFFACGEYGEDKSRPHFHALLFGVHFPNGKEVGESLYASEALTRIWGKGMASFGAVTFASAGYTARYAIKKRTGPMAEDYYKRLDLSTGEIVSVRPEFGQMSRRPGVGRPWFDRFYHDIYGARDGVVLNGRTYAPPRYYDILLDNIRPDLSSDKEYDRYINSERFREDGTPERLAVREIVAKAKIQFFSKDKL